MIQRIIQFVRGNWYELLLVIFVFANLYSFTLPGWLYYVALAMFGWKLCHSRINATNLYGLAIGFIVVITISSLINLSLNPRLIIMVYILVVTLMYSSKPFYLLKCKIAWIFLWGCAFTGIVNYVAWRLGINYQLFTWRYIGEEFTIRFSGFTINPMWLSAACGLGTIFLTYLTIVNWSKGMLVRVLLIGANFLTIFTTVQGGSRSALACSLAASFCLLLLQGGKLRKRSLQIATIFIIIGIVSLPFFTANSEFMQSKMQVQEETGHTSRDALWGARMNEFESSPIYGVGFSRTIVNNGRQVIGRAETGSGWLTVLSQSGLIGFILALVIVLRARLPISVLRRNPILALYTCILLYFIVHSCFEAYLFQGGWYLCFVFWLFVGILSESRKTENINALNNV